MTRFSPDPEACWREEDAESHAHLRQRGGIHVLTIFDLCPLCLSELRRGVAADGKCGHEKLLLAADPSCDRRSKPLLRACQMEEG